jgi:hypothetical protein
VRQEAEQEHFAGVVQGANQPVAVAANIEHHHRIATSHTHLIRRTKAPAQIGKMPELLLPHDSPPDFQTRCGLRVPGSKSNQGAFFDYPHAHNLCSLAELVNMNNRLEPAGGAMLPMPPPLC